MNAAKYPDAASAGATACPDAAPRKIEAVIHIPAARGFAKASRAW
jgi:hypothetical protein